MSARASHRPSIMVQAADGHGGASGHHVRGPRNMAELEADGDEFEAGEEDLFAKPPPLPSDPAMLAEIRAGIERGLAQARAGIGEDWEVVHAELRARLNLPRIP